MIRRTRNTLALLLGLALGASIVLIGGCNTVAGAARDVANVANWTAEKLDNGFDPQGDGRNYSQR